MMPPDLQAYRDTLLMLQANNMGRPLTLEIIDHHLGHGAYNSRIWTLHGWNVLEFTPDHDVVIR